MNILGLITALGAAIYAHQKHAASRYKKEIQRQKVREQEYREKYYEKHIKE